MKPKAPEDFFKDALAFGLRVTCQLLIVTSTILHLASMGVRRLAVMAGQSADRIWKR
jgi:hypothetical protein